MMINLKIPDSLMEEYVAKFGIPGCYSKMKEAISAMKDLDKNDRYVILCGDVRRDIEKVFQTTIDSPEKLAKMVKNLNSIKIQGIEINFTEEDLHRIQQQAEFHGKDRDTFIKDMVDEIINMMMDRY